MNLVEKESLVISSHVWPAGLTGLLSDRFGLGFLDRQEQLEFGWQFIFGVQPIGEVHSPYPAIGMDLHPERLDVVRSVSSPGEIGQVELNLVPSFV